MTGRSTRIIWLLLFIVSPIMHASAQWEITISVSPVSCPGGNNGSATVNVSGQGNYSFQWNDSLLQTGPIAVQLPADTFQVLVSDDMGNDTLVNIIVPEPNRIVFNPQVTPAICNASTGRIKLNVSGGTPPYFYSWAGVNASSAIAAGLPQASYHVVVTDAKGCEADTSIALPEGECLVKGELVFTPNGDGINDTWNIFNINFFPNSKVVVYNRWGQAVHEQQGVYKSWDGTHWGQPVPDATYFYVVYKDVNDKENVSTGSVTIIR